MAEVDLRRIDDADRRYSHLAEGGPVTVESYGLWVGRT